MIEKQRTDYFQDEKQVYKGIDVMKFNIGRRKISEMPDGIYY